MRDVAPDAPAQAARRDLLRLLLLAPAAAACASAAPATLPAAADPGGRPTPAAQEDPAAEALRAVREHPLPPGAEPALVFRALGPGGR